MKDQTKMRALYKVKRAAELRYNENWKLAQAGDELARARMKDISKEVSEAHEAWWAEAQHFVWTK